MLSQDVSYGRRRLRTQPLFPMITSVLILVSITLLTLQGDGFAFSCLGRSPTPEAYQVASDVFIAQVIQIVPPSSKIITNSDGSVSGSATEGPGAVRLAVEETLKGTQASEVSFEFGSTNFNSYPFKVGEKYLVYAGWKNGKLSTGACTRTRPLSKATADLTYIKGAASHEPQATLYGDVLRLVVDADGEPALQTPFEELTVVLARGDVRVEAKAEKSGEYEITLPPGDFEVWVEREGQRVSRQTEAMSLKVSECRRHILTVEFR